MFSNRVNLFHSIASPFALHPDVINYRDRITAKGAAISNADLLAVDTWTKTIYYSGLRNLFLAFYPYAGNDWIAAREALWVPSGAPTQLALIGLTPFNNTSYLRTVGFTGTGAQAFDTGINCNGMNNWSLSVYLQSSGANEAQIGVNSSANFLAQNFSGTTYYGSGQFADSTTSGWYTAQSTNLLRNGTILHTTSASIGTSQSNFIHGRNNAGSISQGAKQPIGCAAIGSTKTQSQELIIYNATRNLMLAFSRAT